MKTWLTLCLALLVVQATATLRPRRDVELTGLAPPSDTFFWRYPPENETGEGKFFSRGLTVAPAVELRNEKRVVVDEPVVVPFGRVQDKAPNGSTYRARRFVINGLDPNKASFLLYPYEFSYDADGSAEDNTTLPENFLDGAFISTLPSEEFPQSHEYYFHWVNMSSTIDLAKAKAVYDMNVAILQVTMTSEDGVIDVTYESDQFCTMFYSYIWGKYSKCFTGAYDYDQYITQNPTASQKPYVMFVNPQNISNGVLSKSSGENRFGILILPDIAFAQRSYVASLLYPSQVRTNIQNFVSNGGVIMTSGKAAMLLETLGLITAGTFSSTYTLRSPKTTWGYGNGCDGASSTPADDSEEEFVRRTLCFSAPRDGNYILTSITSAPLLSGSTTDLRPLAWFDTTLSWAALKQHHEGTGVDSTLPLWNISRSYPMISYKPYGKGYVVANLANPGYNFGSMEWIYNAFFLAGSRPLVLDNEVVQLSRNRTIPALEQVKLQVKLKLTNYFTQDIAGPVTISIWYRNGTVTEFLSGSSRCTESASTATPPSSLVYSNRKFDCTLTDGMAKLSSQNWMFSVYIEDAEVTQAKLDVLLLWPRVQYVDPRGSASRMMEYGVTIGAATAALLRAEMNIDPSSMYPLHADGSYVDNVMNVENKEMTAALEVKHISIVPIITPFIDINDQIRLAHHLVFDQEYYKQSVNKIGNWNYPFNANDVDYLEWDLLYNRSNVLAASWDEAAKLGRVPRSTFAIPPAIGIDPASIMNAEYQTNNDNDAFILRQADFRDSDKFYEHATQRLMAFLDVNEAAAAKTYWGHAPSSADAMVSDPTRGKRRVLFARHDVFFWKKYVQPSGLPNRTTLISIDRYAKQPACGTANKATVAGAFGNSVAGGIIPREWPNELMLDCNRRPLITPAELETFTGGKAKIVHYLVGIDPLDGSEAGDFYGFDPTTGQYQDYPEVKFVKAFRSKFDVAPDVSRRGGEMIFTFKAAPWSSGLAWGVSKDYVQVAADQISVYKISVESDGKLHIRFKRGNMPNENYGQASHLQLFIEQADAWSSLSETTATFNLKELQYDVSSPSTNFEDWSSQTVTGQSITLTKIGAFSMPAARLEFILGDTLENSIMQPYELREPMVRYGIYEQELLLHRAVHGSAEFHPINEPCLVTRNGGFSAVTHIGTSSVPFREYLTTGTSLMIPAATETGRVEWKDIWGRQWVQNVRSTIFEYPPIPPPLRNFVMTTTYELLTTSGKRVLDWRSEDKLDVRVQMKLLNNYPKWFEITNCKANEVLQLCGNDRTCERARIFSVDTTVVPPVADDDYQWIFQGHNASYGICFRDAEVYLSGVHLGDDQRAQIQAITLCAVEVGTTKTAACQNLPTGLPTVSRRSGNGTDIWNWAQQVYDYWPTNYIKDNMWDLTHYDYDDNFYDKAYRYHMDNNLPHLGHWIVKPENIIAFPLYKGLGYSMTYDKTHGNPKFSGKKGWWSDNLQNRDRTLVAGQATSNDISVGKPSLIPESEWIDITQLKGVDADVRQKLGNVYTCRFNRRMPKVHTENTHGFFLKNVYENNVVPVPPNFVPAWETGYDCSDGIRYSPNNISQFPNIVYTETARDWLYFASNLRGGALEDINVLYTLSPLSTATGIKFEGVTKVQDGGRFTYWNPANSRNSFLIVDNPVSNVIAMRNDIEIEQEVIPTFTTTFDALVFHHLTVTDPAEIERQWELPVYTRSYGYGDFAVSVYVGDAGTSCLLTPGGSRARVKFTVMNNAGFDIYMLKNAINSTLISQEAINSNDLMFNLVHALRQPDAYNFMKITIPEAIRPYITLTPSTDVVGIAGLFFDFESINVDYWRDGWKGDYYLDLKVKSNFPDSLRGRMYDIEVELDPNYFDKLPGGKNDPTTGLHDYSVIKFPPISFAVPYNNAPWTGKVFWTSGYATALSPKLRIADGWTVEGARFATLEEIDNLRMCLAHGTDPTMSESDGEIACMESVWATIPAARDCAYTVTTDATTGQSTADFAAGFAVRAPMFPVPVPAVNGPDEAELHLLVRTNAAQLPSGYPTATHWVRADYLDWSAKSKTDAIWSAMTVHAKGAHLDLDWSSELMSSAGYPMSKQDLRPSDTGLADITVTVTNTGDYYAYNVNLTLNLDSQVSVALPGRGYEAPLALPDGCSDITPEGSANTVLYCFVAKVLVPQSPVSFVFRISFGADKREGAGPSAAAPLNMHVLADNAFGYLDLTSSLGERTVRQDLKGPYGLKYTTLYGSDPKAVLTGTRDGSDLNLKITHDVTGITHYVWLSRLPDADTWTPFYVTTQPTLTVDLKERQESLGTSGFEFDFKAILTKDTSVPTVDSHPSVAAETNVLELRNSSANLLLLLLLLPGILVPAAIGAAVFLLARGKNAKPAQSLGYGRKAAYVAQELEPEPTPAPEPEPQLEPVEEPEPVPQYTAPSLEPRVAPSMPAASQGAAGAHGTALPYGPTYVRAGGRPVNIVDSAV